MKRDNYRHRLDNPFQNEMVKCKCGHSVFLPAYEPVKICTHCNQLVFRNERTKFKFLLLKRKGVERG